MSKPTQARQIEKTKKRKAKREDAGKRARKPKAAIGRETLLALVETFVCSAVCMGACERFGDEETKKMIGRSSWLLEQELNRLLEMLAQQASPENVEDFVQTVASRIKFQEEQRATEVAANE